jgi:predicted ATP-dependent endonuclease of OLD family
MSSRSKGFKKTRSGIVILGEGMTEQFYFTHLKRLKGFHYSVEPRMQRNTSISSFEKKIKELIPNDIHVICVFDADVAGKDPTERTKLNDFTRKFGRHKNITLCDSLPAIEYWFLLHFSEHKVNNCSSDSIIRSLQKHLSGYQKTRKYLQQEKWAEEMTRGAGNLEKAIERAEQDAKLDKPDHCPYSNIYKAIRLLQAGKPE